MELRHITLDGARHPSKFDECTGSRPTPETTELRFFTAANWKVSVIVGGVLCLFTLLYVLVVVLSVVHAFKGKDAASA